MKISWTIVHVKSADHIELMQGVISKSTVLAGGFDTETTGLNIRHDKPFLFICGFVTDQLHGHAFVVDLKYKNLAQNFIETWHKEAEKFPVYLAHNTKFDLHMMRNYGMPYTGANISDTMFYIRYGTDAIPTRFGGAPLKLKAFAKAYVDPNADKYEKKVKEYRQHLARKYNNMLKMRLAEVGMQYKTMQVYLEDCVASVEDFEPELRAAMHDWLNIDLPLQLRKRLRHPRPLTFEDIPYSLVDPKVMKEYAAMDVVFALEIFVLLDPIVKERQNYLGIEIENQLIYPLFRMESVGFKLNIPYLKQSRTKLKDYIIQRRQRLYDLAGQELKIGQHALIKKIIQSRFQIDVASTADEELKLLHSELIIQNNTSGVVEFIEVLQELRTLEKWYSAYLTRFLETVDTEEKVYTELNQVGAATGRFSSDFQQFPKGAIYDSGGGELFTPRKMIIVDDQENYEFIFMDYSQIELRLQAMYTILVGDPDLNLCRAYMPYKCVNSKGELFDYDNREHLADWDGEWFYEENSSRHWVPTDVHGVTTEVATKLTPDHPDFKKLRGAVGKRLNFAKNYGAGRGRVRSMFPEKTEDEITRINDAYYIAYPGVKSYHNYCYDRAIAYSNTTNLFGIRYYGATGHKLINLLIQGSAAYLLKLKIIAIDKYIQENNLSTQMQLQIHDEIMFKYSKTERSHISAIKNILEDWDGTLVPIIAECERAPVNWAEKEEIHA